MNKAVRKVSAGTKETPGKKREGRINDSLLGEKNGLARADKLENHKRQGISRIQLIRSLNSRQRNLDVACLERGNMFYKRNIFWKIVCKTVSVAQ